MKITNSLSYERLKKRTEYRTLYDVFSLFIDDDMLRLIAKHINENALLNFSKDKIHNRSWESVVIEELRAYIAIYI